MTATILLFNVPFSLKKFSLQKKSFFCLMASLCYLGQLKADGVDNAIYKLHSSPPFIDKENTVNYSRIIVQNILEIYHYPETAPGFLFFFEILLPAGRFVAILVFLLSGCCHIFNIKSYHVVILT